MGDKPRLEIDLDLPPSSGVFQTESLLHEDVYKGVRSALMVFSERAADARRSRSDRNEREAFARNHVHQVVFVDGKPGSGKSSFLLNLRSQLNGSPNEPRETPRILCLERTLDPNLWAAPALGAAHNQAHLQNAEFIEYVLELTALINHEVDRRNEASFPSGQKDYRDALDKLTATIEAHLMLRRSRAGKDSEAAESGAAQLWVRQVNQGLQHDVSAFLDQACRVLGVDLLVLMVDDVDINPGVAIALTEMLRMIAVSPHLAAVWVGYKAEILKSLKAKFSLDEDPHSKRKTETDAEAYSRVAQLWRKLIPGFSEFHLSDLSTVFSTREILLVGRVKSGRDRKLIGFSNKLEFLHKLTISNEAEKSPYWLIAQSSDLSNLRMWLDMLYATKSFWLGEAGWHHHLNLEGMHPRWQRLWESARAQQSLNEIYEGNADRKGWEKVFDTVLYCANIGGWHYYLVGPDSRGIPSGCSFDLAGDERILVWHGLLGALLISACDDSWSAEGCKAKLLSLKKDGLPVAVDGFLQVMPQFSDASLADLITQVRDLRTRYKGEAGKILDSIRVGWDYQKVGVSDYSSGLRPLLTQLELMDIYPEIINRPSSKVSPKTEALKEILAEAVFRVSRFDTPTAPVLIKEIENFLGSLRSIPIWERDPVWVRKEVINTLQSWSALDAESKKEMPSTKLLVLLKELAEFAHMRFSWEGGFEAA